jgi:hypothetical protein
MIGGMAIGWWQLVALALVLLVAGALVIRLGFRRGKTGGE